MKRFIFIFSVISLMASCSKLPFVEMEIKNDTQTSENAETTIKQIE